MREFAVFGKMICLDDTLVKRYEEASALPIGKMRNKWLENEINHEFSYPGDDILYNIPQAKLEEVLLDRINDEIKGYEQLSERYRE